MIIADSTPLNIRDYLDSFLEELGAIEGRHMKINTFSEADRIKALLNMPPRNGRFRDLNDFRNGYPAWSEQKFDYVVSNLNRGYIFYFLCNRCERKCRYLYYISSRFQPFCRTCCRLRYKAPSRKARELTRLLRKNPLSTEAKYIIIKKAGITLEDLQNFYSQNPNIVKKH